MSATVSTLACVVASFVVSYEIFYVPMTQGSSDSLCDFRGGCSACVAVAGGGACVVLRVPCGDTGHRTPEGPQLRNHTALHNLSQTHLSQGSAPGGGALLNYGLTS